MKVVSCNVNGIRSAAKKGFYQWLESLQADFICLQEIRAQKEQIPEMPDRLKSYHAAYSFAEKPGYSGVAIYTRHKPDEIIDTMGMKTMDQEGRFIQVNIGNLSIASVYFPSGSAREERQAIKYSFMDKFEEILIQNKKNSRKYIFCGDYNIAHKKIDIKNWRSNQKNSGFLPEERQWMDKIIDKVGYIDAFRVKNKNEGEYTWWSNRGNAYANNVGWRIDYQLISNSLKDSVKKVETFKDEKFSDHAPLIIDYEI
ncbi:MAG: exodeoxyribonuclease III [Bdellovibrionota bacterium]